jgi:D-glycerate 3-kinase
MFVNNKKYEPISLSHVEYSRLMFITNMKLIFNRSCYNDNKDFLKAIERSKYHMNTENKFLEFCQLFPKIKNRFSNLYGINIKKMTEDLYNYYIPLANELTRKVYNDSPLIIGIQGHQGCGKSTFCEIMKYIMIQQHISTMSLSIDDLYLPYEKLQQLKQSNSLFKYRGPPGTHDIELGNNIIRNVYNNQFNYELPQYDKKLKNGLGDRCEKGIMIYRPIDILFLEGWFLGAEAIDHKINDLQEVVNENLKQYTYLWDSCKEWIILRPVDFNYSRIWRIEAERVNKQGLSEETITDFVNYFWEALPPHIYFNYLSKDKKILLVTVLDDKRNIYI